MSGRYGKNMRDCCDSPAQQGQPHIVGCVHFAEQMSDKVPDWALEMARAAYEGGAIKVSGDIERWTLINTIASALLSAYRRGVEDSAKIVQDLDLPTDSRSTEDFREGYEAATTDFSVFGAAAIRRLGEAE